MECSTSHVRGRELRQERKARSIRILKIECHQLPLSMLKYSGQPLSTQEALHQNNLSTGMVRMLWSSQLLSLCRWEMLFTYSQEPGQIKRTTSKWILQKNWENFSEQKATGKKEIEFEISLNSWCTYPTYCGEYMCKGRKKRIILHKRVQN